MFSLFPTKSEEKINTKSTVLRHSFKELKAVYDNVFKGLELIFQKELNNYLASSQKLSESALEEKGINYVFKKVSTLQETANIIT